VIIKEINTYSNTFVERAEIFLPEMKAQWDEVGGRLMLGSGAVMLRPIL